MDRQSEANIFCNEVSADLKQGVDRMSHKFNYNFEKGEP